MSKYSGVSSFREKVGPMRLLTPYRLRLLTRFFSAWVDGDWYPAGNFFCFFGFDIVLYTHTKGSMTRSNNIVVNETKIMDRLYKEQGNQSLLFICCKQRI